MWPFRSKPSPHKEVRYVAATKAERKLAHRRYLDRELELAVAVAMLDPEARAAARTRASMGGGR